MERTFTDSEPLTTVVFMHDFERIMNRIENINGIRWIDNREGRWYRFSIPIRKRDGDVEFESWAMIEGPVKADANWCQLYDRGLKIVNRLIAMRGVESIEVRDFDFIVKIEPTASWCDLHPGIVETIYETLFGDFNGLHRD